MTGSICWKLSQVSKTKTSLMNQFIVWSMKCHKLTYICIVICKSQRYSNTFFHLPTVRDPNDVLLCTRSRNQCFGLEKQLSKRCYWSNEVIHVATLLLFTSSAPKVVAILLELAKAMNASSTILLMLASKHQGGTVWWMQTVEIRQFKKRNPQTGNYQDCWSFKTQIQHDTVLLSADKTCWNQSPEQKKMFLRKRGTVVYIKHVINIVSA